MSIWASHITLCCSDAPWVYEHFGELTERAEGGILDIAVIPGSRDVFRVSLAPEDVILDRGQMEKLRDGLIKLLDH